MHVKLVIMRRFFVFLPFILLPLVFKAQDTITVMQYNLLQYGNYQGYGGCSETTNNTQLKDECIRTILDYVRPDIFTVCEFGATQQLQQNFLKNNLNVGVNYWKSDNIINTMGSNIINHIFYDSRKMEMKKHVSLPTSPRNVDVYEMYLKTSSLLSHDTIKLVCIVAHPKAGTGSSNESSRYATMQTVMNYISQNYATENVLIMGDFNMYTWNESGYQVLTKTYGNTEALFFDPLSLEHGVGDWNNNSKYARFHTQSTRTDGGCFSGGGLDDRFDMILTSDEIRMGEKKIRFVEGTYKAIGNDGLHFNQNVNQNANASAPMAVIQALYNCSDHLPVTMKMKVSAHLGVEEHSVAEGFKVYPNPTTGVLFVDLVGVATYRIMNVMGQTVMTGQTTKEVDVSGLSAGIYFLSIDGAISKFVKTSALY